LYEFHTSRYDLLPFATQIFVSTYQQLFMKNEEGY